MDVEVTVRELIAALGMSQREAADALGVNVRTVRYWCAGRKVTSMAIYALRYLLMERQKGV